VYGSDKTCDWLSNHHDWINAPCVCREAATNASSVFDNYSVAAQYEMFQLLWKLSAVDVADAVAAWYLVTVRAEATETVPKTTAAVRMLKYLFIIYPFL
jgi:hypothetical protein